LIVFHTRSEIGSCNLAISSGTDRLASHRWDVVEVQERATSLAATHFLDTLINRMAFLIAALQVDGGSEFAADLNKSVSNEAYRSSCFRPVRPDSTVTSNAPIARTTRTSIR
jgi:hypothetical protein